MVSKNEQRGRVVERLSASLLETGLSETSLRQLAAAARVSDRMLLYYFKDKTDILSTVLAAIAAEMSDRLAIAIPENASLTPFQLITEAVVVTQSASMRPYMRLWIEIVAAASRGVQPYVSISPQIALSFMEWIETRLVGEDADPKHATAAMILAMIDGIALLDVCAGSEQSQLAVQAIQRLTFSGFE
jgi:AcrR family transcriptional regulator